MALEADVDIDDHNNNKRCQLWLKTGIFSQWGITAVSAPIFKMCQ
jgi:hypothetical protein